MKKVKFSKSGTWAPDIRSPQITATEGEVKELADDVAIALSSASPSIDIVGDVETSVNNGGGDEATAKSNDAEATANDNPGTGKKLPIWAKS